MTESAPISDTKFDPRKKCECAGVYMYCKSPDSHSICGHLLVGQVMSLTQTITAVIMQLSDNCLHINEWQLSNSWVERER